MVRRRLVDDRLLDDQIRLRECGVDVTLRPLDRGRDVGREAARVDVGEVLGDPRAGAAGGVE